MKYKKIFRTYHGFTGQRMLILPFSVVDRMGRDELFRDLYIHSMGHFPNAHNLYTERPDGCPEYILIYCTSGKGWYMLKSKEYAVSENHVFILPPDEPHYYESDKSDPWSIYWTHFKGSKAAFLASGFIRPVDVPASFEYRIALFDETYNTLKMGYRKENLMHACITLGHFISSFRALTKPIFNAEIKRGNEFATSVTNWATHYMDANIDKPLKLEDISSYTGYSSQHLYRLFLKETGYAPMQYFQHLKIDRACYYLSNDNYNVSQVARILGFKDTGHFSKLFAKIKKVPPGVYKKSADKK
jgi:AraC family transcriptional regulator, arabinose operon regulatory protein